jgi:hypothetical protein
VFVPNRCSSVLRPMHLWSRWSVDRFRQWLRHDPVMRPPNGWSFSGGAPHKAFVDVTQMSLRRDHPLQRLVRQRFPDGRRCMHTSPMVCRLGQRNVACLMLCAFAGCSTTANISRTDGLVYEAEILSSDAHSLRARDVYGREILISREEVADIDHPGNVLYTIGLVLIGMSTPMIIGDLSHRGSSQQGEWSGMGLAMGIPGVVTGLCLAIPGWLHYKHSKSAARAFEDANPILPVPRPAMFLPYPYPAPYPYPYPPRQQ